MRTLRRRGVGVGGKWQKCVEDNAGVEVDELKHSGAGSEGQTQVLNVRPERRLATWGRSLPRLPVCCVLGYAASPL